MNEYLKLEKNNLLKLPSLIIFVTYVLLIFGKMIAFNKLSMIIAVVMIFIIGIVSIKQIKLTNIMLNYFIIIMYNNLLCVIYPNNKSLYFFVIQLISFGVITIFSMILINEEYLNNITRLFRKFYTVFSVVFIIALFSGKVKMIDGSFMLGIYQSLFAITYFVLLGSKKSILSILWAASMPFLSGERGLAICLLIIFCMYYLLLFLRKNKLIYSTFFFIICICVTVYQFVYVALYNSEIGSILNKFSSIYTDQNFFSGRQFIWAAVNNSILESPIIGYGLGNNVLISNNIFISAHNTYVEIMLNGGFISILLYFMFMYSIWMYLFKYLENNAVRLSASFLIGVIVFGVNGVIIIGNDINFSLYIWLIIGIGIMVRNAISKGVYNRNI